jgi:uncharacterized protein YegL
MMSGTRGDVLPIYFVGDESLSMKGEPITQLNHALSKLRDAAAKSPAVGEMARFGIVTFAGDAQCRLELCPLADDMEMPAVAERPGGTIYGSVFSDLRQRLPADVSTLKASGYKVRRPVVFFLSDGQPTDASESDWREPLARLKSPEFHERPEILAFGIGQAQADVIREVASQPKYAFMQADGTSAATAIAEFGTSLVVSISESVKALEEGKDEIQVAEPDGFVSLKADVL